MNVSKVAERSSMRLTTRPALLAEALGDDMQVDQSTSRIILVLARQETQVPRK